MSSIIKKLAGQTAVYGLSSILGRILGYLLVPLYTRVLAEGAYGSVVEMYSYVALLLVLLTYGMETAFFRFSESTGRRNAVFSTALISIIISSLIFLLVIRLTGQSIAEVLRYGDRPYYIYYIALTLFFDSINTIPFANLRAENKAMRFVLIKISGIVVNIALNLFFVLLVPFMLKNYDNTLTHWMSGWFNAHDLVAYIFISNVISSGLMTLMFLPQLLRIRWEFDPALWKKMMGYALPLAIFGLAGVVNEVLDRVLLKYLLPSGISMAIVGIYGACYKVSVIMTIFIQAYRYAAEPFFFSHEKEKDSSRTYAHLMSYFVMTTSLIFLATMLYIDVVIRFVGAPYRVGKPVIPILLMANMFLGIYYNLSIWYKLTDRTRYGAWLSIFGALITITLNLYWIPRIGYMGSAWATFICYGSMMVASYFLGRKYYPVPYDWKGILFMIALAWGVYAGSLYIEISNLTVRLLINTALLAGYVIVLGFTQKSLIKPLLKRS